MKLRTEALLSLREPNTKRALRAAALISTVLGTLTLYRTGEPAPPHLAALSGLLMSLGINAGLWACTFEATIRLRYLLALYLLPAGGAVAFVMLDYHLIAAIAAFSLHLWLTVSLVRRDERTGQ